MAIVDFLKNAASKILSPLGAPDLGQKLFGTSPKPVTQQSVQQPVTTPAPTQRPVQGPQMAPKASATGMMYGPTQAPVTSPLLPGPAYTPTQVNAAAQNQKFSNSMTVSPATTVSASALSPDNTMSGLLNTRKKLEEQYLKTFEPNDNLTKLAGIKNEIADVTEEYDRRIEVLEKNPNGVFGQGVLGTQLTKLRGEKNKELGYLAMREAAAQGVIDATKEEQANLLKGIEQVTKMTSGDLVGSLQTDDVTGEVSGFFRDPTTGKISQQIVGKTSPKMDLTYQKIGNTLYALDSQGNLVKQYGGNTADGGQQFSDDLQAYAQQYASDGKKPTSIPEGMTFGQIAAVAANLPKGDGLVVDNNTNIKSSGVAVAKQEGISALYDIYTKIEALKELDKGRWGGVVSGTLGKLTGDKSQEAYIAARDEIVDLLARARTGAALTAQEEAFYKKQLPGRFDEAFFLGADSDVRIDNFATKIKGSLESNLANNNLSIYGFSDTTYNGQTVKVGTPVEAGGVKGYIGPNGKIYVPDQPTGQQTSFSSPGSGNVPQRNNNPGNIKAGGLADNYAVGTDEQGHLIFPDAETGFNAFAEDVYAKVNGGSKHLPPNPTLQQLGAVYAEDPNWPFAVARILGVPIGTPTQNIPFDQLVQAIATQEGFYA